MMTSSNGNISRVTGPSCGEFIGHRWTPRTKASDAELRCFLWSVPKWTANICEAGDLRRHRGHYDVIVMKLENSNSKQHILQIKIMYDIVQFLKQNMSRDRYFFNCTGIYIVGMRYLRRIYLYIKVYNNMTEVCAAMRIGEALLA